MCDQHKAWVRARKKSALLNRAHDSHDSEWWATNWPEDRPSGAVLEDGKVARHEDALLISDHRTGVHEPRKLGRCHFAFPSVFEFPTDFDWDNQLAMALRCR